jgi:hypothetical protein
MNRPQHRIPPNQPQSSSRNAAFYSQPSVTTEASKSSNLRVKAVFATIGFAAVIGLGVVGTLSVFYAYPSPPKMAMAIASTFALAGLPLAFVDDWRPLIARVAFAIWVVCIGFQAHTILAAPQMIAMDADDLEALRDRIKKLRVVLDRDDDVMRPYRANNIETLARLEKWYDEHIGDPRGSRFAVVLALLFAATFWTIAARVQHNIRTEGAAPADRYTFESEEDDDGFDEWAARSISLVPDEKRDETPALKIDEARRHYEEFCRSRGYLPLRRDLFFRQLATLLVDKWGIQRSKSNNTEYRGIALS